MRPASIVFTLALALSAGAATAQQCGPVDQMRVNLAAKHGEQLDGIGMVGGSATLEIWANRARGTFTVLRITAGGVACMMAAGTGWSVDRTRPGEKM